jgi:myo-inositol-1(or 4)-monophosphatase
VTVDLAAMLALATRAARAAADVLRGVHAAQIVGKSNPRDLVTEWDPRSEQTIREVLAQSGHAVLGEEGGQEGADTRYRWIVDPIDGTVNFAHGMPIWAISIALEEVGKDLLVGVVAAPAIGWWFEATKGGGARDGAGTVLRVSACTQLDQAMLTTGFPYDLPTNPANNLAEWAHLQRTAGTCRRFGVASLDMCFVAAGWCDGYWERRLKAWDIAAGALIVTEAGGTVTSVTGGTFDVHSGEAVATNGAIHDQLVTELARVPS